MTTQINGTSGITFSDSSVQNTAGINFRNRIINGAMMIDQRNAGASVTPTAGGTYLTDRWGTSLSVASKFSGQQSSTAPTGYKNSLLVTSLSAYSVGASDNFCLYQAIEGLNCADLGWGAVGASTVTLSFWVRSSLTGAFGGSLLNSANTRSYPFTYTISAANTWEQKSVTVAGDTTGTWLTTNGVGIYVFFGLGVGSTYSGTAGSWAGTTYLAPTGSTSVVGTNGATFYITGVQLEKGTTASSFDFRSYSTELALCQRYYQKSYDIDTAPATATNTSMISGGLQGPPGAGGAWAVYQFPVPMRTAPTVSTWDAAGTSGAISYTYGGAGSGQTYTNGGAAWGTLIKYIGSRSFWIGVTSSQPSAISLIHYAATAEL